MRPAPIQLRKMKDLRFSSAEESFFIHAASGLLKYQDRFYVVSDDELSMLSFSLKNETYQKIPLRSGTLPWDAKERKKLKPDWEALTYLPSSLGLEGILVIPSGSKPNRQLGSFVPFNQGFPAQPQEVDFSIIYKKLQKEFAELNIEGGAIINSVFKLFQRGNGSLGQNAIIDLDLVGLLEDLKNSHSIAAQRVLNVQHFDLGHLDGVPLGFTDGFAIDGVLFFLAVAENSSSTYDDGLYTGAVLGCFDSKGNIQTTWEIDCPHKPEGLWMEKSGSSHQIYIVTDADDPSRASSFYEGRLE